MCRMFIEKREQQSVGDSAVYNVIHYISCDDLFVLEILTYQVYTSASSDRVRCKRNIRVSLPPPRSYHVTFHRVKCFRSRSDRSVSGADWWRNDRWTELRPECRPDRPLSQGHGGTRMMLGPTRSSAALDVLDGRWQSCRRRRMTLIDLEWPWRDGQGQHGHERLHFDLERPWHDIQG